MYFRDYETDAEKHREHIANLMRNAAERLKVVKEKMKLKKKQVGSQGNLR